jgi:homoaconitase/3-isopropylmalate dehydratase large subunit
MGDTLTYKIIKAHLAEGDPAPGKNIALRIDQTLTQDATGTAAYLQFEMMGLYRLRIFALQPGVILDRIVIDTGGVLPSHSGPPESCYVE